MIKPVHCPICNENVEGVVSDYDDVFCSNCGREVHTEKEEAFSKNF